MHAELKIDCKTGMEWEEGLNYFEIVNLNSFWFWFVLWCFCVTKKL